MCIHTTVYLCPSLVIKDALFYADMYMVLDSGFAKAYRNRIRGWRSIIRLPKDDDHVTERHDVLVRWWTRRWTLYRAMMRPESVDIDSSTEACNSNWYRGCWRDTWHWGYHFQCRVLGRDRRSLYRKLLIKRLYCTLTACDSAAETSINSTL